MLSLLIYEFSSYLGYFYLILFSFTDREDSQQDSESAEIVVRHPD